MTKLNYTLLVLAMLVGCPLRAQRTMPGQPFVGGEFLWTSHPCGELSGGAYLDRSLWEVSLGARTYLWALSSGDDLLGVQYVAAGTWQYRLLCTRSRSVNLYAGGGVFAGYEAYDPLRRLPPTVDTGLGDGAFVYGLQPCVKAEFFVARRIAVVTGGSCPLVFGSSPGILRWHVSAGLRFCL